jgi:hypothetical protein
LSHKTKCAKTAVVILVAFLSLSVICLGDGERRVVFEEVGQYADGGMAVAVLVVGDLVYLCEFDRGVVILDVSDPESIVEIGRLPGSLRNPEKQALSLPVSHGLICYPSNSCTIQRTSEGFRYSTVQIGRPFSNLLQGRSIPAMIPSLSITSSPVCLR